MQVYFDNAATTPLDPEVVKVMTEIMSNQYGNPSSIHSHGRQAKTLIEQSRKNVAKIFHTSPSEIFFTSGGTESDNMALIRSAEDLGVKNIISSPLEHHAVLHTLDDLQKKEKVSVHYLSVDEKGMIDFAQLESLLSQLPNSLVSLMHGNNEIGNLTDLAKVSELCRSHAALFHSDTVQTVGHYEINLSELDIDFITGSAHKFHGPKGVGFIYINGRNKINPLIYGGAQERNMRGGTENIYGIAGLSKALEISSQNRKKHFEQIQTLKNYMIGQLQDKIPGIIFNGLTDTEQSLCTILNVSLPCESLMDMLLFNIDIKGISASGGSACSSGSELGSHVLNAIQPSRALPSVRFSFSKYNTIEEVDFTVETLKQICQ